VIENALAAQSLVQKFCYELMCGGGDILVAIAKFGTQKKLKNCNYNFFQNKSIISRNYA
jgi:hypothetical protein